MAVALERFKNWSRVRAFFLDPQNSRYAKLRPWVAWADTLRELPVYDRLAAINARVDARIAYGSDEVVWHRADYWEDPLEVVRQGRTDCEGRLSP
jgi:predicted transglutaminase-like cysteine proteinase